MQKRCQTGARRGPTTTALSGRKVVNLVAADKCEDEHDVPRLR